MYPDLENSLFGIESLILKAKYRSSPENLTNYQQDLLLASESSNYTLVFSKEQIGFEVEGNNINVSSSALTRELKAKLWQVLWQNN